LSLTVRHRSLSFEGKDCFHDFISKGIETNRESLGPLEFVQLEYCSTGMIGKGFELSSVPFEESNGLMEVGLCTWLTLPVSRKRAPGGKVRGFPPSVKKRRRSEVSDGIIGYLTRECRGNAQDHLVVDVASSEGFQSIRAATKVADVETDSRFYLVWPAATEAIPHTKNKWIFCDFKNRLIVPIPLAFHSFPGGPSTRYMKS
jgi:hypothetical protein